MDANNEEIRRFNIQMLKCDSQNELIDEGLVEAVKDASLIHLLVIKRREESDRIE